MAAPLAGREGLPMNPPGLLAVLILAAAFAACSPHAVQRADAGPSPAAPQAATPSAGQAGTPSPDDANPIPPLPATPAAQSQALTSYLQTHRLPLVGVNVVEQDGHPNAILYGFVATPFGKQNAADIVRRAFRGAPVTIQNRILVRPELLAANANNKSSNSQLDSNSDIFDRIASTQSYPAPDQSAEISAYQRQSGSNWGDLAIILLTFAPLFIP
jgi:hypothetical protein